MNEHEPHELPNCRDILAQMGPLETLLGSVSYSDTDSIEGKTQQIRTSARVFKKMKFDLTNNAALEKKETKKEEVKPEDTKQESKKTVSPLWTSEEKCLFFEALNEYGKDFESIHLFISTRLKKRGFPEDQIKTKYQIRNFYYRTFHMCGNLNFSESIPKNVQELYTLINYGEIRKKGGTATKKGVVQKLGELVNKGQTSLKIKGKTVKVKTPMCKALRRLNKLNEKYDDLKLPTRVLVELKPRDMVSFLRVQSMAQNPRIRMALPLQKRLNSLIYCINNRWKNTEAIIYDKALVSTNPTTKECVPEQKVIDDNLKLLMPSLRLTPPLDAHIELPSIDISEYFTGQSICLTAFENRRLVKAQKDEIKKEESENNVKAAAKPAEESTSTVAKNPISVHTVVDDAVNTILSLQTQDLAKDCDKKPTDTTVDNNNTNTKNSNVEDKNVIIDQIRQGWTVENCGSLTIGELYLMFGSNSKLLLEYCWENSEVKSEDDNSDLIPKKAENHISSSLHSLLSLAKLQSNKSQPKCTCGHVCGAKTNATPQFKRPISTKIVKKNQANQENAIEDNDLSASVLIQSKLHKISNDTYNYPNPQMIHLFTQLDIERLNSKCRNKGKPRCKQLVVERKLVPNKTETKHQIVSMNIIAQENPPAKNSSNNNKEQIASSSTLSTGESKPIDESSEKDFCGILCDNPSNSSMSTGISKILKENENQWINSDVDYSLSSLLGHLDGATKTNQSIASISNEDSQLSHDVDAQLRTLLIETSVDYTAKFADLAAKVVDKK